MRAMLVFALVTGCGFAPAAINGRDAALGDATDAPLDTPDANPNCFGSQTLDRVCLDALPGNGTTFTGHDINTDGGSCFATTANGVPVCVIAFQSITFTTTSVIVVGSKPLVLVATAGAITLNPGLFDIGSHFGRVAPGPGVQSGAACTAGATAATVHGGGYGGTFTHSGAGGGVDNNSAGAGVPATAQATPTKLVGGCPGDIGGGNLSAAAFGGGAIALIAPVININATLTASGAGGAGTSGTGSNVGGNGGGAGGLIILDAAMSLNGSGFIYAQGGGGGEGSAGNTGFDGHDGYDVGAPGLSTIGGGNNSPNGGDGGDGGSMIAALPGGPGASGGAQAGGGGGGGGAGSTIVFGATPAGTLTFSPLHQ